MIFLRSLLFFVWFVTMTVVLSLIGLPSLLFERSAIVAIARGWSRANLWGLKTIAGLDYEVRGTPAPGGVLVASKHMSMWDTIALYLLLHDAAPVLKRELMRIPFYGWFAWKAGVIAIDRGGHAKALRQMVGEARAVLDRGRTILIFPEGHRMAPGAPPDYKPGVAALYGQLNATCVPVALNSGLFWTGPIGFLKKPGRITVEFLEPIAPGLKPREFLKLLEARIEPATQALVAEGRALLAGESATHVQTASR